MTPSQDVPGMLLVGGLQPNPSDGDYSLMESLLGRMKKEVKHTGDLTRYVGYESYTSGKDHQRFFGIEVNKIEDIPQGMVAWDLRESTWAVWEKKNGRDVITWQENVNWQWLDQSSSDCCRLTGEFAARCPVEWSRNKTSEHCDFRVSANAYVGPQKDGFEDEVHLTDYDTSWPQQFDEIASWLREYLGPDVALRVEHYGSTAIPGMPAKPIIDVLVAIPSFAVGKKRAVPRLNSQLWEYWWYSGHMIFIKRKEFMGQRTHHIHMAPQGHELWDGLAFRDYLRSHHKEASDYATLKYELASSYREDRERYTIAKGEFVHEVTSKALRSS